MKKFLLDYLATFLVAIYTIGDMLGYRNEHLLIIIIGLSAYFTYTIIAELFNRSRLVIPFNKGIITHHQEDPILKEKLLMLKAHYDSQEEYYYSFMSKLGAIVDATFLPLVIMADVNLAAGLLMLALVLANYYTSRSLKRHLTTYAENN